MELEPFYVTLPSNASMDFYPTNKISQYRTKLPKSISLSHQWEVGLCELIFPANWYNVVEGGNTITFFRQKGKVKIRGQVHQLEVEKGFLNIHDFLQEMEYVLMRYVETGDTDVFSYPYDKVVIRLPRKIKKMVLNDHLAYALGFTYGNIEQSAAGNKKPIKNFMGKNKYIFTVETKDEEVVLQNDIETKFSIPEAHYDSPEMLLNLFNTVMNSVLRLPKLKNKGFLLNKEKKIVEVKLPFDGIEITLDAPLAALLGFNKRIFSGTKTITGEFPYDVKNSFYSLFVYTDIIQSQMIGDTYAKLLQVTPAPQRTNTIISHTFNPIQYVALERHKFETIEIAIRNSAGDLVPFTTGLSIVKLHFRPKL